MQVRVFLVAMSMVLVGVVASAQQSDMGQRSAQAADAKVSSKAEQLDESPKLTGRLPRYFSSVVSPVQRQQIYRIQSEYRAQLERLKAEMDALRAKQAEEITSVLSDVQRQQVESLRISAQSKRAERLTAKTDRGPNES